MRCLGRLANTAGRGGRRGLLLVIAAITSQSATHTCGHRLRHRGCHGCRARETRGMRGRGRGRQLRNRHGGRPRSVKRRTERRGRFSALALACKTTRWLLELRSGIRLGRRALTGARRVTTLRTRRRRNWGGLFSIRTASPGLGRGIMLFLIRAWPRTRFARFFRLGRCRLLSHG